MTGPSSTRGVAGEERVYCSLIKAKVGKHPCIFLACVSFSRIA
jgi:hypothetical protein